MLLALDIGNSAMKAGLFDGEELVSVTSIPAPDGSSAPPESSHWREALTPILGEASIARIGLGSVVPSRTDAVTEALRTLTDAPLTSLRPSMPLPFNLGYDTPDTLGVDRLAAAAAGWVHYGQADSRSVLVIDAGTAVNYEVIHREGRYEGGAIGAGPVLLQQALRTGTAQLPDVPLTLPTDTAVGRSTQTALQSGIMWGLVDSVRGMCDRLAPSLPDAPRRVLTGGWGALLAEHLDDTHHAPHLILHGVRLLTLNAAEAESRPT